MMNKDPLLSLLKFVTNLTFYISIGLTVIFSILFIITLFAPTFIQNLLSVPIELNLKDAGDINLEGIMPIYPKFLKINSLSTVFKTNDIHILRVVFVHYFILTLGLGFIMLFWKRILNSFIDSNFYSKDNQVLAKFLGGLLIIASPFLWLENLILRALIDYRIHSVFYASEIHQVSITSFILIVIGLLMLFVSRVAKNNR